MPEACIIPIQRKLDELNPKVLGYLNKPTGTLDAITSEANGEAVQARLINTDGKTAKYAYTYLAPNCTAPTDCAETPIDICATGNSNNIQTGEATIEQCLSMPALTLTMAQYRDLCNFGPNEFQTKQIMGRMIQLRAGISDAIATDLCAALGCFSTGVVSKELAMLDPNTRIPNWSADEEIMLDFEDRGVMIKPILIGGRSIRYYQNAIKNGGLNDAGVDLSGMDGMIGFYDNRLNTICEPDANKETLLAITPGVFQVVSFLENVGMFATDFKAAAMNGEGNLLDMFQAGQTFAHGVIQDPISGWMFDLDAIYVECDKLWTINISTKFDTLVLPLLGCNDACFNGLLKYQLCELGSLTCATPVS